MSRGNPRRLSSNTDSTSEGPRGSRRGTVRAAGLASLSGGGSEPRGSECWRINPKYPEEELRHMTTLAIAAANLKAGMESYFGIGVSIEDTSDYIERNRMV